jgi:hypothetical protein
MMRYHFDAALPFELTLEAFRTAVESRGAELAEHIARGPARLEETIWRLPGEPTAVRYIRDHFVDVAFARIESERRGRPADAMRELEAVIEFRYAPDLLRQTGSTDPGTRAYALRSLAVTTPSYRVDVYDAICAALFDGDPRLRGTAMTAIARWPYARFAGELERLAATEAVPELQREAVRLAADLVAHGRRGLS